jgi:glycosyltransferase involved in cell wall biosynthesis
MSEGSAGHDAPAPRPRVLIVNWRDIRNPEAGGAEVHLQEVSRRLVRDGFAVVQYSHAYPGAPTAEIIDGVEIHRIGGAFLFNYTVWFGIREWVKRHRIDVVLDDSNKIPFLLPLRSPVPVLARFHHLFGTAVFRETGFLRALYVWLFEALIGPVYRRAPVITVSESTRRELAAKGILDVTIAPNAIDKSLYRAREGAAKEPGLVLHIGRLKKYKRLDLLLEAIALVRREFPGARLLIGGAGDYRAALEARARALGLGEGAVFLGRVSDEEKVGLYNRAQVFVNSSLKEGWGLTTIEANACGTPVVATDVPGLRDSVLHGETGFLVPFGDAKAFAGSILAILRDPALAARLRARALEWAGSHDWERAFEATRDALLETWRRARGGMGA